MAGTLLTCLAACQARPAQQRKELTSGTAVQQATAAVKLAERGDEESIPRLVGLLDDGDPAVRMYAILALEHLTGETFGYKFYASQAERAAAVERWQAALRAGRFPAGQRDSECTSEDERQAGDKSSGARLSRRP